MFRETILAIVFLIVIFMWKSPPFVEKFEEEDLYIHEDQFVMNSCDFSPECCPSPYSSDKGCACVEDSHVDVLG